MKQTDAKKTNIQKVVSELLSDLSVRQRDVIIKRFGLKNGKRKTLEEIGDGYGITRERVRQIENDAKSAILKSDKVKFLEPFSQALASFLNSNGGIRAEYVLFNQDAKGILSSSDMETSVAAAHLYLLLSLGSQFVRHSETDAFHPAWAVKNARVDNAKMALQQLTKRLNEAKDLVKKDILIGWLKELAEDQSAPALESYLAVAKNIAPNVYGEYGLAHWPEVKTRGVRDKAYLVLKKNTRPMHFKEIVNEINKIFSPAKSAHLQTVHNELIKDDKFVLVGRGTYALSDWGYKPGRVSDVLMRILKDAKRPLSREEIVEAVYKERNVKPNTIVLNLQNKKYFEKMNDGKFVYKS